MTAHPAAGSSAGGGQYPGRDHSELEDVSCCSYEVFIKAQLSIIWIYGNVHKTYTWSSKRFTRWLHLCNQQEIEHCQHLIPHTQSTATCPDFWYLIAIFLLLNVYNGITCFASVFCSELCDSHPYCCTSLQALHPHCHVVIHAECTTVYPCNYPWAFRQLCFSLLQTCYYEHFHTCHLVDRRMCLRWIHI